MNDCKFKDKSGYCRHKENQERGRGAMRCRINGCPHFSELEDPNE